MLGALGKEASDLGKEASIEKEVDKRMFGAQLSEGLRGGLKKSKSEAEFEEIGSDEPGTDQGKGNAGGKLGALGMECYRSKVGLDNTHSQRK